MHKRRFIAKSARWFSQWSRKAYAIFLSISKVVHIGKLSVDISKQAVLKSNGSSVLSLASVFGVTLTDDLVENPLGSNLEALLTALFAFISELFIPKTQQLATPVGRDWFNSLAQEKIEFKIVYRAVSLTKRKDTALFRCINLKHYI